LSGTAAKGLNLTVYRRFSLTLSVAALHSARRGFPGNADVAEDDDCHWSDEENNEVRVRPRLIRSRLCKAALHAD